MRLVFKVPEFKEMYPADVDRIIRVCADKGYEILRSDAVAAWDAYSDSMCAGWMMLPDDDDDIFDTIMTYCAITR